MEASGSGRGTASTERPMTSGSQTSFKRSESEAQLAGRNSPPKKQQLALPTDGALRNLSAIILVGRSQNGGYKQAALGSFADKNMPSTDLRPQHFNHERFRDWAEGTLGIPRDAPIHFGFINTSGFMELTTVSSEIDFITVLTKLWTNAFRPFSRDSVGDMIRVEAAQPSVPPASQDAAQVEQPVKPQPEAPAPPTIEIPSDDDDEDVTGSEPNDPPEQSASLDGQQPLAAKEFLRLVREATTPDDVSLIPAFKDEPDAESRLYKIDAKILKKALIFFNTNINDEGKCSVKDMEGTLHIWQIYTAFEMFTNPVTVGVNGLCIGLDVGFGKTRLILLYLRARAHMLLLENEVKQEWSDKKPEKHLPSGKKPNNACCPSQQTYMVQCPCSWDSHTRQILDYMVDLPALIIGPPGFRDTWMNELKQSYVDFGKDNQMLQFYLYGNPTPGHNLDNPKQKGKIVEDTRGFINRGEGDSIMRDVENGSSLDVFLISNLMAKKLVGSCKPRESQNSRAAFGVFIMDEVQNFKGTETHETMPFQALHETQELSSNPVTLFAMSGTLVEEGPSIWRGAVEHFKKQWADFGGSLLRARSGNPPDVLSDQNHISKYHKQLIRAHTDDSASETDTNQMTDAIRAYLQPFVRSLRRNQMWRGRVLNGLLEFHERDFMITPLDDPETKAAMESLLASVETAVTDRLTLRKKDWVKRRDQAHSKSQAFDEDEPTRQDVVEGQLSAEKNNQAWLNLSRASSYPYITVLRNKDLVPAAVVSSRECQSMPVEVQAEIEADPTIKHVPIGRFDTWELPDYADKLKTNSPKLEGLLALIHEMINDESPATAPTNDPCTNQHAIVFFNHTISAVLTYFFLITDRILCQRVQPILLTSSIKLERRQEIMKEMARPGRPGDRNKVLLAVTDVSAEGYNLQRVNNVWFMELPTSPAKYLQAVGCACRTGQKMKVGIVRMYDLKNRLETTTVRSLMGKKTVSEQIYNIKTP